MMDNDLKNYYETIFIMKKRGYYSIQEIEGLYPFERDIIISLYNRDDSQKAEEALRRSMEFK